jgi:hypothetical protein
MGHAKRPGGGAFSVIDPLATAELKRQRCRVSG